MHKKINASELKVGDVISWKTGNFATVISVEVKADVVYVVCQGSMHIYDRELKKNQLISVERDKSAMEVKSKHPYQLFYEMAYSFLVDNLPEGVTEKKLDKYFISEHADYKSIQDVFGQFILSAQNYQGMPKYIKFTEREADVKRILYDYNLEEILENWNPETLYARFRKEFKVESKDSVYNSWYKWSKSIVDSAKFLSEFKDVNEFIQFADLFKFNVHTRMALPLLISQKIRGIGFALACDALKELGFVEYPKPDVHLMEILSKTGMCEKNEIQVFETIVKISQKCKEVDKTISPYKIDKILWDNVYCLSQIPLRG